MALFQIISAAGVDMGTWEATSRAAALDKLAREQDYRSAADAEAQVEGWGRGLVVRELEPAGYRVQVRCGEGGMATWEDAGDHASTFPTAAEAEAAIESLRAQGGEWADARFRVVAVDAA